MFCRHCGKRLPDDSKFCTYCGKSVVIEDEGASAGQEPEPAPVDGRARARDGSDRGRGRDGSDRARTCSRSRG